MAVNYKIYQSNAKNSTYGKYYARATYNDTVNIKQLAAIMQSNCTVKQSDILAVLSELAEVMKMELQHGNKVKIDGLGIFKLTITSKGAEEIDQFSASENITGARVRFMPEHTVDTNGRRTTAMLAGLKMREQSDYESLRGKTNADKQD